MAAKTQTLKFKRVIDAPAKHVYNAFTNAQVLREWLCNTADVDPRKGGRIYLWWNTGFYISGEFSAATPDKSLAFSWFGRGEPHATQVRVSLSEKNRHTAVTLTHSGVGTGKKNARWVEELIQGWESGLENLQSVLEEGPDLRFVRRPMLGIMVDAFDAAIAEKMGVPTKGAGVRLSGTVAGMGSEAAGLQKDDVIVGIGSKKVAGFTDLGAALQKHQAGDTVKVKFYRGGELMNTNMTLSGRPIPEVPDNPEELAEIARKHYAEGDAALEKCFEGVSEEQAEHRPAPDEWSAKETLAHLIGGERDTQFWLASMITDSETVNFPNNSTARYVAMLTTYASTAELLAALKHAEAESLAMLANLPDEFVQRRSSYWRIAQAWLFAPYHAVQHVPQIQAAIDSAKT